MWIMYSLGQLSALRKLKKTLDYIGETLKLMQEIRSKLDNETPAKNEVKVTYATR